MIRSIKVGTRPSPLALKQVEEIQKRLHQLKIEVVLIKSSGDKDKISPISQKEDNFFTLELGQALLNGVIDAAVHSAKDLEENIPDGLLIAARTASVSPFECLVSRNNLILQDLPSGSRIGTSSQKRKEALKRFRPDLKPIDIRGNIDERLAQLEEGEFDAIIVAHAALIRLGYQSKVAQVIPEEIIEPHPLQGRIAIQIRKKDKDLLKIFKVLDEN